MAKINFKKASQVDEGQAGKFFGETPPPGQGADSKPEPQKKVRVFVDLAPDELQKLDRLVMEKQMLSAKVVYRSVVAKEMLLEALGQHTDDSIGY